MRKKMGIAVALTAFAALVLPAAASAETVAETLAAKSSELNMVWVAVACVLVFLMQAGFMFLEIGFSRQKNVGTGVAKILVNFAIVTIAWWAVGYGIAEGGNGTEGLPAPNSSVAAVSSSTSTRWSRAKRSPGKRRC